MKIKPIIAIAIAGTLVACSSPAMLRANSPEIDQASVKPAKVIAMCISDQWENGSPFSIGTVPVSMRETSNGYTVMWINGAGGTGMLADIENIGSGSRTRSYRGGAIGTATFEVSVRDCQ